GPRKPDAGARWTIPESLGRKFSRVLGPGDEDSMPRPPEVATVHFTGKVVRVADGLAFLAYEGSIAGSHRTQAKKQTHGQAKLTGVGSYDVKSRRLKSLVWVFDGIYRGPVPYDQPAKYSGVAEWNSEQAKAMHAR